MSHVETEQEVAEDMGCHGQNGPLEVGSQVGLDSEAVERGARDQPQSFRTEDSGVLESDVWHKILSFGNPTGILVLVEQNRNDYVGILRSKGQLRGVQHSCKEGNGLEGVPS